MASNGSQVTQVRSNDGIATLLIVKADDSGYAQATTSTTSTYANG